MTYNKSTDQLATFTNILTLTVTCTLKDQFNLAAH